MTHFTSVPEVNSNRHSLNVVPVSSETTVENAKTRRSPCSKGLLQTSAKNGNVLCMEGLTSR